MGDIDHGDRVAGGRVGLAKSGDLDIALTSGPPGAALGFRGGEAERREGKTGVARARRIGAGDCLILEHTEVRNIDPIASGRERDGKGQPAGADGTDKRAPAHIDHRQPEVCLLYTSRCV